MKTKLKKNLCGFFAAIVLLSALSASLGACKIPSSDSISAIPAGTINASFGTASSASARSAVPDLAAKVAVYVITCANTDVGTSETAEVSGSTSHQFTNVVPGKVKIGVSAYNSATTKDATTLIATGESSITLGSGEGANVSIQLSMAATGASGKIELEIDWPATLADAVTWKLDGTAQTPPVITPGATTSSAKLISDASAGSHAMAITFTKGGATVGTAIETVNVYANLTSNKWIDSSGKLADARKFTAADFAVTGTDFSVMVLCGTNTYQIAYYSTKTIDTIWVPTGTTSITIIPTCTTAGQKIQYTCNGPVITAQSGNVSTISSLTLPATIPFDVTAPNGTSTQSYTLTVNGATPINSATALASMSLIGNYVLTADINLSSYGTWTPIGSDSTKFTGNFDGGGHTVSNLSVTTTPSYAGMFGYVDTGAVISNVRLKNVTVNGGTSSSDAFAGGLAGYNMGAIYRCSTEGTVSGYRSVGGLVGESQGTIRECYSMGSVSCIAYTAGGLVGFDFGEISNCYARGTVSGPTKCGGLIGGHANYATISTNSYAAGTVTVQSGTVYGGLEGFTYGGGVHFTNCFYDSSLTSGGDDAGTGTAMPTASMKSRSTFTAAGWDFDNVWAIDPNKNNGYPYLKALPIPDDIIISSSMAAATIQNLLANNLDGNFILSGPIDLSGYTWTPIGSNSAPFTGTFDGGGYTISNANVTVDPSVYGGFFVFSSGTIKNLKLVNLNVQKTAGTPTGGLVGYNTGIIYRCSTTGTVTGPGLVGGLVGNNHGTIRECYSSCTVSATSDTVGGLVGQNVGPVINCYARGTVSGPTMCGGLFGRTSSNTNKNSYAAVMVTCDNSAYGGLRGGYSGICSACFYDSSLTSGGDEAAIGTATSNAFMKDLSTFTAAGWDFYNVWAIASGTNDGYPYLSNNAP